VTTSERSTGARALLAGKAYEPLWSAARRRLEGNGISLEGTPLKLAELSPDERAAVCGLLGRRTTGDEPVRVRLGELDEQLRRGAVGCGLLELLELIGGPVRDRKAERDAETTVRHEAWSRVESHPVLATDPRLGAWVAEVRRAGTATRLAGSPAAGAELTLQALDILAMLPADNVPLARLAAAATTDSHSLDRGQPLGTLLASALETLDPEEATDRPSPGRRLAPAYWWRRRWSRAGVVCDDLSVSVLVLNLPVAGGDEVVAETVRLHRQAGEPLRLTLRQLAVGELNFEPNALVHLCENPAVLTQAAILLGDCSAPLVCVEGQPNSAVDELLTLLTTAGARLRHHGDFDWGGLRIADTIMRRHGAEPWRFSSEDYVAIAARGAATLGPPPAGAAAPWDPPLLEAMTREGRTVYEEHILDLLLPDLDLT
jgi:uncharacterized protein (TIGR02679 family)